MGKDFFIHSIDNGFCRVNYWTKNDKGQRIFYCLQDEGKQCGGVTCYRSSQDFEPGYPVTPPKCLFEEPTGESETEQAVREYLNS